MRCQRVQVQHGYDTRLRRTRTSTQFLMRQKVSRRRCSFPIYVCICIGSYRHDSSYVNTRSSGCGGGGGGGGGETGATGRVRQTDTDTETDRDRQTDRQTRTHWERRWRSDRANTVSCGRRTGPKRKPRAKRRSATGVSVLLSLFRFLKKKKIYTFSSLRSRISRFSIYNSNSVKFLPTLS